MSSEKHLIEDISAGKENYKIPLINKVDFEKLPRNFQYTSQNFMGIGSYTEDSECVSMPCSCMGICVGSSCSCNASYGFAFDNSCIKSEFVSYEAKPIIECSPLCKCDAQCPNRITQQGVKCKLQLIKTKTKGFGVQTLNKIKALTYVCEYAGEIIGISEAKRRFSLQRDDNSNYIFVITEHCHENNKIITVIDSTFNGNVGRFLNHSCSPNLFILPVRSENMIPKICFFAKRDISPFEELCYDYGTSYSCHSITAENSIASSSQLTFKKCCCESAKCTGYLPFSQNLLDHKLLSER